MQTKTPFQSTLVKILICFFCLSTLILFSGCENEEENDSQDSMNQNEIILKKLENFSAIPYDQFTQVKKYRIGEGKKVVIIDIRTAGEIEENALEERDLDMDFYSEKFLYQLSKLDKSTTYLIYCRSGNRTQDTRENMRGMGFEEVYDLKGGISAL